MRHRMLRRTVPEKISFVWIAWLICTACTSEMTVAVTDKDNPIQQDTLFVDGPTASICDAVVYPDAMSSVRPNMNVREFEDGRLTALFEGNVLKIDDGEIETSEDNSIDFGAGAIITDDDKLITMYREADAGDPSRFFFVIIQRDGDIVDWRIRIPEKRYDPYAAGDGYNLQDGEKSPVFTLSGNTLTVAGLFSGEMTLAEGQTEEIALGDPDSTVPSLFIARYDRSNAALIGAATVDEENLLVPASISLSSTGERITLTGRPLGAGFDVFAVGQYSILGEPIWVDNTGVAPESTDFFLGFGNMGAIPTTVFERPGGGIYVYSTFFGIKYISDRFGAETTLGAPVWVNEEGYETKYTLGYFAAAFDENGVLLWAKNDIVDPDIEDPSTAVSAALLGDNLLLAGQLKGDVTLGKGEPNETTFLVDLPVVKDWTWHGRPYLAAYQPDGTLAWARIFDENFVLGDLAVLPDDGIRVFGTFDTPLELTLSDQGTTLVGPGSDPALGVGLLMADVCPE